MSLIRKLSPVQALVLSFGLLILLGTILLCLPIAWESGNYLTFIDALFTSTSAVCVTGLIVVDTPLTFSTFGEIIILMLIQFGGIGIITFATAFLVLMGQEVTFRNRMILKESFSLKGPGSVLNMTLTIIKITLAIEFIGAILLYLLFRRDFSIGQSIYLGIFHAISAFCNAGFSLFSKSLEQYTGDWGVNLIFMILIILGGLGFPIIAELLSYKKGKKLSLRAKIVFLMTAILIFGGALSLHIFAAKLGDESYLNLSGSEKFLACLFQSVTARTAGFNSIGLYVFPEAALIVLITLMFIGGAPTGTAGGIKSTTLFVILLGSWSYVRGYENIKIWRREIHNRTFHRAIILAILAFLLVALCTAILTYFGEGTIFDLAFEAVSAFGTVGLTLGATSNLNTIQKLIIILLMFIGRIGPMSFALFFITRKRQSRVGYPVIDIPTG